jgi:hypothetical protein
MSTASPLAPTEDKHGRVADGVPCAFLCRGSRPCTRRARDPTTAFCSAHQPDVLEAARALARLHFANGPPTKGQFRASDAPRKRISSSQKRMMNPFSSGHRSKRTVDGASGGESAAAAMGTLAALAPNSLASVFDDPTRPLHVDIGCARGLCVQQCAISAPQLNYLGIELRPELVTIANQWCDARFGALGSDGSGGRVGQSGASSEARPRRNLHFVAGNINACIDSLAAALPVNARCVDESKCTGSDSAQYPADACTSPCLLYVFESLCSGSLV